MKRDPKERFIKIHMDSISVKKIRPLFLLVFVYTIIDHLQNLCIGWQISELRKMVMINET